MKILFFTLLVSMQAFAQKNTPPIQWLGKPNRIANPGAESNSEGAPLHWKSDFSLGAESNWVSAYGVTSHEWNHGEKKLGLPTNPGNNYFRLTVNKYDETRKLNVFQIINLEDIQNVLQADTVIADFQSWIGVAYPLSSNCSYTEVKVLFKDLSGKDLDSIYIKRNPGEFRDLDAGTPAAEERGFNVMHELLLSKATKQVPKGTKQALVKIHCEYPCAKFKGEEQDETEAELSNTFFFDNISLGFYKK